MDRLNLDPRNMNDINNLLAKLGAKEFMQRKKSSKEIKEAIKRELFYSKNDKKNTELHEACVTGNNEKIQEILNKPGVDINAKTSKDVTPLMLLCRTGNLEGVKLFMKLKCDLNVQSFQGQTALFICIVSKNFFCALELLKAEDEICINIQDRLGNTPLMRLVTLFVEGEEKEKAIVVFKKLLSMGAKLDAHNANQENIFHVCARSAYSVYFNEVVLKYKETFQEGELVNELNVRKHTPIVIAATMGKADCVKTLLSLGADPYIKGEDSESLLKFGIISAYHEAAAVLSYDALKVLLDYNGEKIIGPNMKGHSILQELIRSNPNLNVKDMKKFVELIVEKKCVDLKRFSMNGDTVLHYAAWHKNRFLYDYLVSIGADTTAKNFDDLTPPEIMKYTQQNVNY